MESRAGQLPTSTIEVYNFGHGWYFSAQEQALFVIVFLPGEDEAGALWAKGIASEWSAELSDPREDIYTLDDGEPVNETR